MSAPSGRGLKRGHGPGETERLAPQCGQLLPPATLPAWPDDPIRLTQRWGANSSLVLVVHPGASRTGKLGPFLSLFHAWSSRLQEFRRMAYDVAFLSADRLADQGWLESAVQDGLVILSDETLLLAEPLKLPTVGDEEGYVYAGLTLILRDGEVRYVFEPSPSTRGDVAIALKSLRTASISGI